MLKSRDIIFHIFCIIFENYNRILIKSKDKLEIKKIYIHLDIDLDINMNMDVNAKISYYCIIVSKMTTFFTKVLIPYQSIIHQKSLNVNRY